LVNPYVDGRALPVRRLSRFLVFALAVNDTGTFDDLAPVLEANEDEGTIAAILWRDY
jgi:hypothetical protein